MCQYSLKFWSDRWSAACYQQCSGCRCHTSNMAPVTEFTAVLWFRKYGTNYFFPIFRLHFRHRSEMVTWGTFAKLVDLTRNDPIACYW